MRNIRRRRRRAIAMPEITLTPLIDTALTLLVIFMITTPIMKDSLKLTLPEVKNSGDKVVTQNKLEIFVSDNQSISLNDKRIKLEKLNDEVKKWLKQSKDKIIIINGDKSIRYDFIMKILDQINAIEGEKYVALACKRTNV